MIIDMHAHINPENFPPVGNRASAADWPFMDHFEPGRANVMINGKNFRTITASNWDVEKRLADMEKHGAQAQAISPMPELLSYWFTPEDGRDFARHVNEYIKSMCDAAPGHFFGLGMVPLQDPDLAAKELSNVKELGLQGVELGSNIQGKYIGAPEFQGFFQEAERLGIAVFVHSLKPSIAFALQSPSLTGSIGFPTDTCLTISSFIAGGTAAKVPNLRIAFSHGGGTFPFLLGRYNNQWSGTWNDEPPTPERLARASDPVSPFEYARRFFYDTLLFDRRAIRFLVDMIGHTQVMVGTDYPYQPPEQPADKSLRSLGLPENVVDDITWNNTFRFLNTPAPVFA